MLCSPRPNRTISVGPNRRIWRHSSDPIDPPRPGDQDPLPTQVGRDEIDVQLGGLAAQQVLDLDVPQIGELHAAVDQSVDVGKGLEVRLGVTADLDNLANGFPLGPWGS